jgi:transcription elongation factor Elf1
VSVEFPCLRCGGLTVNVPFSFVAIKRGTISCDNCNSEHYLSVKRIKRAFQVCYQRYTLRYPLENYSGTDDPPVVILHADSGYNEEPSENVTLGGPVIIYPRKKSFKAMEVSGIWKLTNGLCHICEKPWKLEERSVSGWHIDHVIPHIGGGKRTEQLSNFRIACAKCNLKKGRGYTEKQIQVSIRRLIEVFQVLTI